MKQTLKKTWFEGTKEICMTWIVKKQSMQKKSDWKISTE